MRILVTGSTGMLGKALVQVLSRKHDVIGVCSKDFDIRDGNAVMAALRAQAPQLVVHLAAYTDVDGCEEHPLLAQETNAAGTESVAQACAEIGATLLYISTDYVFDGKQTEPYTEDDRPNPINVYGSSKWLGEKHLQALLDRFFIVRTSWLFGPWGKNFVRTILRLAGQQQTLRVVSDQLGSPTYTRHLASKLSELLETEAYGIYHVTGSGSCSWFEFAQNIVDVWPMAGVKVVPISSGECGRPARRPTNSVLENRRLSLLHTGFLPHWKAGLASYLEEIRREGLAEESKERQYEHTVGAHTPRNSRA